MFAHQPLCNPKVSTLLKATRRGFVRGCPNMSAKLILKYLNPSPATAKGHMKQPRHGIRSTTKRPETPAPPHITPVPIIPHNVQPLPAVRPPILPLFQAPQAYPGPAYGAILGNHPPRFGPNIIDDKSHRSDIREVHAIAGLSGEQQHSKSEVSRVGYDNEHTFQHIVPFSSGSAKSHMRTFFHGFNT